MMDHIFDISRSQLLDLCSAPDIPGELSGAFGPPGLDSSIPHIPGKLSAKFSKEGKSVMLAAGDTFRCESLKNSEAWTLVHFARFCRCKRCKTLNVCRAAADLQIKEFLPRRPQIPNPKP